MLYFPQFTANEEGELKESGLYQAETHSSINAAKRHVRADRLTVRRGKPPTERAARQAAAGFNSAVLDDNKSGVV